MKEKSLKEKSPLEKKVNQLDYEIVREVGLDENGEPSGGFGRVYQVRHKLLDEFACLKTNKPDGGPEQKEHAELLRYESKILWRLCEHHSIPSAKHFFKIRDDYAALIMDYIEGDTLEKLIKKKGRLHAEDACFITERLLGAIYYAHCFGVIHSDIKPQNVFVEPKKRDIKLIDFGLANYKPDSNTIPLGYTPAYVAPEIKDGKPPIPQTDIFGAGLILLYALGGNIRRKEVPDDTPGPVADFCKSLLRYDPMRRPSWEHNNPLLTLSDVRQEAFGRRHRNG